MKKKDLKNKASALLKKHPKQNEIHMTKDGQGFFSKSAAINHAKANQLGEPTIFFREGYEDEDDSDLQTKFIESTEQNEKIEAVLEAVIDISNTDTEDTTEVNETSHEAIKYSVALRTQFEDTKSILADANAEIQRLTTFETTVIKLIEGNTTKIAESIRELLPKDK